MLTMLKAAVVVLLASFSITVSASWQDAASVIDSSTKQVMTAIEPHLKSEAPSEDIDQIVADVESALGGVVDFDYMAKRVMGKYYRRASAEERDEFSVLFKATLLKTYTKALLGFRIQEYRIIEPSTDSPKPNKQAVSVVVRSTQGVEYTVVYYMLKQDERWTLVNAAMDGINLRLTFKSQFSGIAQQAKGKVAKAIEIWRKTVGEEVLEEAS